VTLQLKFVVCKPLHHRCHHSPEAYNSPQNAPKLFGGRALLHALPGSAEVAKSAPRCLARRGGIPRKGKKGRERMKMGEGKRSENGRGKGRRKGRWKTGKEGGRMDPSNF